VELRQCGSWCIYNFAVKRQKHDKPGCELPEAGFGCVGYRVRRLSRVVSAIYDDAFGPLRLKISQFGILAMLGSRGPLTAAELCRLMVMDRSTASRNLQRMRRRGWLSVGPDTNGTGQTVALAPEGARVLRAAYPLWREAQEEATRRLGTDGLRALEVIIERIRD
jgi:DNA-binding MarR family transcriptional regulator